MSISFLKKITVKNMGLTVQQLEQVAADAQPKSVPVLRVWGIVSNRQAGTSQFGNYIKFSGEIAAMNLVTGEEARSQALLLPSVGEAVVATLLDKAAKDGATAQVALEITVEYNNSAKGGTKFAYGVKPLIEFKGDDALSEMAKALPAPKILALPDKSDNVKKRR